MNTRETTLLAIESSCDETAVAVMRGFGSLLASGIASQSGIHERYGGVVPEVASRNHLLAVSPLVENVINQAGITWNEIDAVASTLGPGLAPALLVGASLGKALALSLEKPFLGINHMEGHLLSPFFGEAEIPPHTGLVVSGGHTLIVDVKGFADYEILGRTLDDAAGEAFDKVAKLLSLPYPGGPEIERRAIEGDPTRYNLPRGMQHSGDWNFSFSGLKTAVRYLLEKEPHYRVEDVAASFQSAVVEVLTTKAVNAAKASGRHILAVSGGVSLNGSLRAALITLGKEHELEIRFAPASLCTDNAAMIASVAAHYAARGGRTAIEEDIFPSLGALLSPVDFSS